jgi:hypothetical protein
VADYVSPFSAHPSDGGIGSETGAGLSFYSPVTLWGAHFDITLQNDDLLITGGYLEIAGRPPFRVGPHVPETGSTLPLLWIALTALGIAKTFPEATFKS